MTRMGRVVGEVSGPKPRVSVFPLSRQTGAGDGLMAAPGHDAVTLTGQEDAAGVAARLPALAERVGSG